jgi:hypothetical protein
MSTKIFGLGKNRNSQIDHYSSITAENNDEQSEY